MAERRHKRHGLTLADGVEKHAKRYVFSHMIECGFCGATLTHRSWHVNSKYRKPIWQCITATKYGKTKCPHSKGMPEEALEKAFVRSYIETCHVNKDVLEETVQRLKNSLQSESFMERIKDADQEISKIERQIDRLLDLHLERKIAEDIYTEKYQKLSETLERAKAKPERWSVEYGKQEVYEKRVEKIRKLLESHMELEKFDADVFLSTVKKVIIGGFDDEGNPDPTMIKFVYKTGITDSKDGETFKPPRRNFEDGTSKKKDSAMESASHANIQDSASNGDVLSTLRMVEGKSLSTLHTSSMCAMRRRYKERNAETP